MALKLGAEDKKKVYIAGGLGLVVLALVVYNLAGSFGGSAPPPPPPQQAAVETRPTSSTATGARPAAKVGASLTALDPTLHPELMAGAESLEYSGKGRNIFSLSSAPVDIPEPVKSPRDTAAAAEATGPPPVAPPPAIDLKFFGYTARSSGPRRAFLLKGDDVFVASEGDVVDHRYKVVKIAPLSIQVEDIPYANTQSLPLVQN